MPSSPSTGRLLDVDRTPGKPPMLSVDAAGDPRGFVAQNRDALRATVAEHGSLLVRGLGLRDPAQTGEVFRALANPMAEREAYAPRQRYADGIYSSTRWPSQQPMCMHHELSYALEAPGLMLFACLEAAEEGGATPVADAPAVLEALPGELVRRFELVGWLLIRNYNEDIGASIAESFGTGERRAIEGYCRANAIELEWPAHGTPRTRQRRSAVVRHPRSGRQCWFNQIAFLSAWTMDAEVREYLVDTYGQEGLPFDTRFGDGAPIGADIVQRINEVYEANTARERWQAGDLMLVDNIRTAHGREPFSGRREMIVGLADAVRLSACSPTIDVVSG